MGCEKAGFESCFPIWESLEPEVRRELCGAAYRRSVKKGTIIRGSGTECAGLLLIQSGRLSAYMISEEGREVTLYRLYERDICLFSAACVMNSIKFDITVEADSDSEIWVIPAEIYQRNMLASAHLANFTNELMAQRFSEVMWLFDQVLFKKMDARLARFLLDESAAEGKDSLAMTHDAIARSVGTAREVVTRMLKYFSSEGLVSLARGEVCLKDREGLEDIAG